MLMMELAQSPIGSAFPAGYVKSHTASAQKISLNPFD
jgi:hypothetical protein